MNAGNNRRCMELVPNAMMAFHDSSALTDITHVFWMSFMLGSFINHEETSNVKEKLIGPHRIWKSDCRVFIAKNEWVYLM